MKESRQPGANDVVAYAAVAEINPVPDEPYRGVWPFRFIDQQIFVGRENETWNLISSIMIYRGVLLYGGSGSGKSSMINAGLIPQARKENFIPNVLRVQPCVGREIRVERIPIEEDGEPPYLPSSFTSDDSQASFECSIEDIHKTLKRIARNGPPEGLIDYTKPPEPRPMLIFDQFEEFVTLFEEAASTNGDVSPNGSAKAQRAILDTITDLIHDESLPIKILFVFREDYLGKLSILFENSPDLLDQYLRLLPPRVDKLEEIIRAPFENPKLSAVFLQGQRKSRAEELLKLSGRIAAELRQHSGGSVNLSELQIVCRKLWDSDNPSALMKREKSIQTLIEDYWAEALNKFPDDLRDPAVALLGHMITSSKTRNIVSEDNLITDEEEHFKPELLKRALEALVDSKLVRREPRNNLYFYEIVSEYLVPWIQRLRDAQRAEFDRIKVQQDLDMAETQNRALRKWRRSLAFVSVLLLFVAAGAFYLYGRAKSAEQNARTTSNQLKIEFDKKQQALDEVNKYSEVFVSLQRLTSTSRDTRLGALEDIRALAAKGRVPSEARKLLPAMILADTDKNVIEAGRKLLSEFSQETSAAQSNIDIHVEHVDDQDQKARADRIKIALIVKGMVLDNNYQYGKAPDANQVRYCNIAPEGFQPADMVQLLSDIDGTKWTASAISDCGKNNKVASNSYQIFFASDRRPVLQNLLAIENQWKAAKVSGDVGVFQRIFAPEFQNIDQNGNTYNKAEWIDRLRDGNPDYRWQISNARLLDYGGNTATLRFEITTGFGREIDLDVFVKRNGRWQVLSSQSTSLQ